MISSSLKTQYGYSVRREIKDFVWAELCSDIAGLKADTPLGNIVRIRKEKDPEVLKNFTPEEKRIRNEWLKKNAKQISSTDYKQAMEDMKNMFISMSKQKGEVGEKK